MIGALRVENFKAFRSAESDFRPLTVLTGLNSTGKSTVIQALLLTQLAIELGGQRVPLNGPYGLALGEALHVSELLGRTSDHHVRAERTASRKKPWLSSASRTIVPWPLMLFSLASRPACCHLRDGHVDTYLSAERLGPRDLLEIALAQRFAHRRRSSGPVHGPCAGAVRTYDHSRVAAPSLHGRGWTGDHAGGSGSGVAVEHSVRPVLVEARWLAGANAATLRFRDPELLAEWSRPANVGFGLPTPCR